jgi:hypothetical protein
MSEIILTEQAAGVTPGTGKRTLYMKADGKAYIKDSAGAEVAILRTGDVAKGDVGLGSVDNTSDATKNAAVATLTNKTLIAPVLTGSSSFDDASLAAISQSIHYGTIVKAIIYDTSKGSDGGAFRKRCSDKSWSIEALGGTTWLNQAATAAAAWATSGAAAGNYFQNTTDGLIYALGATSPTVAAIRRGNTREFPEQVAPIISALGLFIYDLTQVGTPLWRFFPVGATEVIFAPPTCVSAAEGIIVVGTATGAVSINFVSDRAVKYTTGADQIYKGGIAQAGAGWN